MCGELTDDSNLSRGLDASFGHILTTRLVDLPLIVPLLPNISHRAQADSKAEAEETGAHPNGAKPMALPENQRERSIEEKAKPVQVAIEQCCENDDGLRTQEPKRSGQSDTKQLLGTALLQVNWQSNRFPAAVGLLFPFRSPCEDDTMACLATVSER